MKAKDILPDTPITLTPQNTIGDAIVTFSAHNHLEGIPLIDETERFSYPVSLHQVILAISKGFSLDEPLNKLPLQKTEVLDENIMLMDILDQPGEFFVFQNDHHKISGILSRSAIHTALLKSRNRELTAMESFFESSYDGIYITHMVNGRPKTLRINKSYERITGLHRENMLNRYMDDLVEEGYISESGSKLAITKGKTVSLNQTFKSGLKGLITSTPVKDEAGNVVMVVTNVRDITELTELKNSLDKNKELAEKYYTEIEAMKEQFLQTPGLKVKDPKMLEILYLAKKVAQIDSTVLLLGESGVGKEEIAKFIHKNSTRNEMPFIKINCGAIPDNLIESELFGYEKGAFTGASNDGKKGLFEVADGGTLFLDEIGELSLDMQVKLLRVLQEQEITKIGSVTPIKIDVRILSATNKDLSSMVKAKLFRADLFYRLNVVPISVPPLRERKEDIFPLVNHFLKQINQKYQWQKSFSRDALDAFYAYTWPGNVRELSNLVERSAVISSDNLVTCNDLPGAIASLGAQNQLRFDSEIVPLDQAIGIVEEKLLTQAYAKYGNVRDAAKALNIAPATFVRKRKKYAE